MVRRWNGWGEEEVNYPLPAGARDLLVQLLGPGTPPGEVRLEDVLSGLPAGRLPDHPLISADPEIRLRHSRGQSLPDWIELRSGRVGRVPDGVAFPESSEQVRQLLEYAQEHGISVIPYGGGTSVVGHLTPVGDAPVLALALGRMDRLLVLDEQSHLATFQAGVSGPRLEEQLAGKGFTLGHYPQSFEYSTLGGWVVTRSSGQQSLGYGRIERLFAGGRLETPRGTWYLPPFPASAAGPDLRELVLGSEGRSGVLTEVTVRVRRRPSAEYFGGCLLPGLEAGMAAVQELVRQRLPLVMLRLSDPLETATTLAMAGNNRLMRWLDKYLSWRGWKESKCLLLFGAAGSDPEVVFARRQVAAAVRRWGGMMLGGKPGRQWYRTRFQVPYLRNSLWEGGYAVDTLETAVPWRRAAALAGELVQHLQQGLAGMGEKVHAYSHLSHVYTDGCSIYVTYLFRLARHPEENMHRWRQLKELASRIIVQHGGTISHQHGVGLDHKPYLQAEKGDLGLELLEGAFSLLDRHGIMNPGKLC